MPRTVAPSPVIETPAEDRAAAPSRATGTLTLGFGMTSIPCSLYAGCEDSTIKRGEYVERDGEFVKVGRQQIVKATGEVVTTSEIVKLVESERGLLPLTDDEIAAAIGCEGGYAQVERFIPLSVMNAGFYIVDSLYQLRPAPARSGGSNGRSRTTEQAFGLLIKAMRLEGVFALVKVALRGKPRYAAFMPDGRLYTLRFASEVRLPLPLPSTSDLPDSDVMVARMAVAAKTSTVAPVLHDDATEAVRVYVEAKASDSLPEPTVRSAPDSSYATMIDGLRTMVTGMGVSPDALTLAAVAR